MSAVNTIDIMSNQYPRQDDCSHVGMGYRDVRKPEELSTYSSIYLHVL